MDDKIFLISVTYIIISIIISGILPSSLYVGTHFIPDDVYSFRNEFNETALQVGEIDGQLNFVQKVLTFMFVTWKIEGIPNIVASLIFMLNLFSIFIPVIWVYDKIRGIG